jgi:hypothetical protein
MPASSVKINELDSSHLHAFSHSPERIKKRKVYL